MEKEEISIVAFFIYPANRTRRALYQNSRLLKLKATKKEHKKI